jgi:hypothetical protein
MRSEVLTLVALKITVFWEVTPFSLEDIYQCFHECVAAAYSFETLVLIYQTAWRHFPEDSMVRNNRPE